jgi:hypothetical protein
VKTAFRAVFTGGIQTETGTGERIRPAEKRSIPVEATVTVCVLRTDAAESRTVRTAPPVPLPASGGAGGTGRKMRRKPIRGQIRGLLEGARFLEKMGRAGDDPQFLLAGQCGEGLFVESDYDIVPASDDQQNRRNDFGK